MYVFEINLPLGTVMTPLNERMCVTAVYTTQHRNGRWMEWNGVEWIIFSIVPPALTKV